MELQQLKYFLLVMECCSFSKAAEKGFTSQPNISKNIAALETSLNTTLFERKRNGVIPTPEAIALSKRLYLVMMQLDNLMATSKTALETTSDIIRIGFAENMNIEMVAAGFFRALKETNDAIGNQIRLQSFPTEEIVHNVANGTIDLGFVYSVLPVDSAIFNRIAMTRDKPRLYYSVNHDVAKKEEISVEDFKDATFVTHDFRPDQNYVRFNGLPFQPEHILHVNSLMEISLYVSAGIGVTVLGPSQMLSANPNVRYIELEHATSKLGTDAIWLNDHKNNLLNYIIPCLIQA